MEYDIELQNHIKMYGEHNDYHNPSFSIKDVFDRLSNNRNLSQVFTRLLPKDVFDRLSNNRNLSQVFTRLLPTNNNIISGSIKLMHEPSSTMPPA